MAKLKLDARIDLRHLRDTAARSRLAKWLVRAGKDLKLPKDRIETLHGTVLEVRQGYKSADSKRQNADIRFGARAYAESYLPVVCIVSTQASRSVCRRYKNELLLVLLGTFEGDTQSTFGFFREVIGYDLAQFFKRNTVTLRKEFTAILKALLTPD